MPAANAEVADQTVAVPRVSANVQQKLGNTIQGWSHSNQSGRTLVIEPRITELKFVSSTKRFFPGDLAGSSAVIMHLKLTDADSGKLIGEPEFYQRAAAEGGTWTFGATDKALFIRIACRGAAVHAAQLRPASWRPTGLDGTEAK